VRQIDDPIAAAALTAERVVVTRLGGGCQMPIGAYAVASEHGLTLTAVVVSPDGARTARAEARGLLTEAELVGTAAAEQLLERGAAGILADVDKAQARIEGPRP
jgi:hydroxymethylbilane synthase